MAPMVYEGFEGFVEEKSEGAQGNSWPSSMRREGKREKE